MHLMARTAKILRAAGKIGHNGIGPPLWGLPGRNLNFAPTCNTSPSAANKTSEAKRKTRGALIRGRMGKSRINRRLTVLSV